jgi:hypothetical protein
VENHPTITEDAIKDVDRLYASDDVVAEQIETAAKALPGPSGIRRSNSQMSNESVDSVSSFLTCASTDSSPRKQSKIDPSIALDLLKIEKWMEQMPVVKQNETVKEMKKVAKKNLPEDHMDHKKSK